MITEPTSSVSILRRDRERGWMTALVWHPRLECWLAAGGHVEENETAAQCGIREALEEVAWRLRSRFSPASRRTGSRWRPSRGRCPRQAGPPRLRPGPGQRTGHCAGCPGSRSARPGPAPAAGPVPCAGPGRAWVPPGWPGAAGTSSPAACPRPGRPPGCRCAARAGRWPGRLRLRPGPGVRALGDRLQASDLTSVRSTSGWFRSFLDSRAAFGRSCFLAEVNRSPEGRRGECAARCRRRRGIVWFVPVS